MTTSPILRPSSARDRDAIIAILFNTFETTWRPQLTETAALAFITENRPAAYFAARGHEFWVAYLDGVVIGFVDWEGDFVNALHVRDARARSGVGTALMNKAEAEIAKDGFSHARLETDTFNLASQAFYKKRGYAEADRYPDLEWNSGLVTLLLVKTLS
jgi:GNAT superfamily N-acetyltransferase